MPDLYKLVLCSLSALVLGMVLASPAAATSTACSIDCVIDGDHKGVGPDDPRFGLVAPGGDPYDWYHEFPLVVTDSVHVNVNATGHVYVVGPIRSVGPVEFDSGLAFVAPVPFDIVLPPIIPLPPRGGGSVSLSAGATISIESVALVSLSGTIEAATGAGGRLELRGDRVQLMSELVASASGGRSSGGRKNIDVDGDVYIDVSLVELLSLTVKAGKTIVVSDGTTPTDPIPEPATALLFGLGLAGLAAGGSRVGRR